MRTSRTIFYLDGTPFLPPVSWVSKNVSCNVKTNIPDNSGEPIRISSTIRAKKKSWLNDRNWAMKVATQCAPSPPHKISFVMSLLSNPVDNEAWGFISGKKDRLKFLSTVKSRTWFAVGDGLIMWVSFQISGTKHTPRILLNLVDDVDTDGTVDMRRNQARQHNIIDSNWGISEDCGPEKALLWSMTNGFMCHEIPDEM